MADKKYRLDFKLSDGSIKTVEFVAPEGPKGEDAFFETDETLTLKNGVLSVNTADEPEADNTLPITSAAVHTTIGNINALLETI